MEKCEGISGKLFGHKFEGRYDVKESEGKMPENIWCPDLCGSEVAGIIESTKSREEIYVHDICIRCGLIIKKEEKEKT